MVTPDADARAEVERWAAETKVDVDRMCASAGHMCDWYCDVAHQALEHIRTALAALAWRREPDADALAEVEVALSKIVHLLNRPAPRRLPWAKNVQGIARTALAALARRREEPLTPPHDAIYEQTAQELEKKGLATRINIMPARRREEPACFCCQGGCTNGCECWDSATAGPRGVNHA